MIDIVETEQGRVLRELADATDRAEAFRAITIDPDDGIGIKLGGLAGRSVVESKLATDLMSSAAFDLVDTIRAHAQAKLDAKVESLHAEFGALMEPGEAAPKVVVPMVKKTTKRR